MSFPGRPLSFALVAAAALGPGAGCGARTDLEAAEGRDLGTCGDGVVDPGEACDGGGNQHRLLLLQGGLERVVSPVSTSISVQSFYAYSSKSAHTGFEEVRRSKLFLHHQTSTGELSLVSLHGIDIDATGIVQPFSQVRQRISGLPPSCFVSIADDGEHEFFLDEDDEGVAIGDWEFEMNTDGGAIGGLPFPGEWSIQIDTELLAGVDAWDFVDGDQALVGLDPGETATLASFVVPGLCKPDCSGVTR